MIEQFTMRLPFEGHVHFRQGDTLKAVVPFTAKQFWAAIAMPNTSPPIVTCDQAVAYAEEIEKAAAVANKDFHALTGFYLTEDLEPDQIVRAFTKTVTRNSQPKRLAQFVKFYPKGATTNSHHGVENIMTCKRVLIAMEKVGMPLCLHGEVNAEDGVRYDHLERERVFVKKVLPQIQDAFPKLKIILEHISTREAVQAIRQGNEYLAATVTPQHLMFTHADLFEDGLRPHLFCMPILKHQDDLHAIKRLVFSDHPRVFAGSDSAPHMLSKKHSACCPAGVFSAPGLVERYATIWLENGKLASIKDVAKFERFMSLNGPAFYGFTGSRKTMNMHKTIWSFEGDNYAYYLDRGPWDTVTQRFFPLGHKATGEIPFLWKMRSSDIH